MSIDIEGKRRDYVISPNKQRISNARVLRGMIPLPKTCYIGQDCNKQHGIDGQTVRYITNRECVDCCRRRQAEAEHRKRYGESKMLKIDSVRDAMNDTDYWDSL